MHCPALNAVDMQQLDLVADAKLSLHTAIKRFETLTSLEQLQILAFVLRYSGGGTGFSETCPPTSREPSAAAIRDESLTDSGDSKLVVSQPLTGSEPPGGNDLRKLGAAANIQIIEESVFDQYSENQTSSHAKAQKARNIWVANQPAWSFQSLSIAITMVVSFSLTLGIMLWQRRLGDLPSANAPATVHAEVRHPPPAMVQDSKPSIVETSPPAVVETSPYRPGADEAGTPMPVRLSFGRRIRLNKVVGKIFSSSNDSMVIAVLIDNASTHRTAQTQVSLAPNGLATFGVDDGLELESGDHVTLQSTPYSDQVAQVP